MQFGSVEIITIILLIAYVAVNKYDNAVQESYIGIVNEQIKFYKDRSPPVSDIAFRGDVNNLSLVSGISMLKGIVIGLLLSFIYSSVKRQF